MDFDTAVVFDKPQPSKLVHEMAHARPGRSDHFREKLLIDLGGHRMLLTFLAEICEKQERPRQAFFTGIEQMIDDVRFELWRFA